jgi:hypothetical protein
MAARGGVPFAPRSRLRRAARRRWRADGRGGALGPRRAHSMARLPGPPRLDPRELALLHVAPLVVGGGEGSRLLHRELQHPHPPQFTLRRNTNRRGTIEAPRSSRRRPERRGRTPKLPSFRLIASATSQRSSAPPTRNQPPGTGAARETRTTASGGERAGNAALRRGGSFGFSERGDGGRTARPGDAS